MVLRIFCVWEIKHSNFKFQGIQLLALYRKYSIQKTISNHNNKAVHVSLFKMIIGSRVSPMPEYSVIIDH